MKKKEKRDEEKINMRKNSGSKYEKERIQVVRMKRKEKRDEEKTNMRKNSGSKDEKERI